MIHDLKPYPVYKDSGVPWLGKVPEHWKLQSLGSLTTPRSQRNRPDLSLLSVVREKGVIPRSSMGDDENHNFIPDDLSNYKVVNEGELVINKMKAWQGSLGISPQDGIVSPAYYVLEFQISNRRFGHILLRSKPYVAFFGQVSDGVRIGQWDLSINGMKRIPVVIPPLSEQSAVVRYLDHFDRRIRHYIHAKKKLIKLLEEQKQAIIHQAVTRGLDPNVKLKPSGVEWLGDVPEHWQITRLSRLTTRIGDGLHGTPEYVDESPYHFINGNNLSNGSIKVASSTRCVSADEFHKYKIALDESTLLLSINGTIGNVALYRGESIILGKSAAYINCRKALSRNYLFYFLQSGAVGNFFRLEVTGTTIFNLSLESIRNFPVALPSLNEQLKISSFLDLRTVEFNELIEKVYLEIALLREYRTRLIADVITGKLDVREAAANLSKETDETETLDDALAEDEELESNQIEDEQAGELEDEVLA